MKALGTVNEIVLPERIELPQAPATADAIGHLDFTRNRKRLRNQGSEHAHPALPAARQT